MGQKISLHGPKYVAKEFTLLVILSGEYVTERLSSVFSAKQSLGGYKFKCDRNMEKKNCGTLTNDT
jgi:hypothetical protein